MRKSTVFFWITLPFGILTLALLALTIEDIITYTGGLTGSIIYIPALAVVGTVFLAFLLPRTIIFRIRESESYINSDEITKDERERVFGHVLLYLPITIIGVLLILLLLFLTGGLY